MNIPKISINNPVFITMLMVALVVVGLLSFAQLPVDLLPNVSFPIVAISVVYPGASAADVETNITKPIEEAVSSLNGVDVVTATSQENLALITIQFTLETDPQRAAQDVQEKINAIRGAFPRDALSPTVQRFDFTALPIMTLGVADKTGKASPAELRRYVDQEIKPRLERIDGVAQVNVTGGLQRQIQVQLNLDALRARRLAPAQVTAAIAQANASLTGGKLTEDGKDVTLRTPGDFQSLDEIGSVVITQRGVPIYVRDVAAIVDGFADQDTYSRLDGSDSIAITIQKQSGSNTVNVADEIQAQVAKLQQENPSITIVVAGDQSEFIRASVEDSLTDLILGGVFAALVVLFFFRDLRNTIVTVIGLPVIIIGTFAAMGFLNLSLNLVTLLALTLAVGLVIDDAIVVRENIFRHMERGEDPKTASLNGTNEVGLSVLAMTLTVVSVFLPIAFVSGIVGRFFSSFGLTVTSAVLLSLFEAFTLAPMLSAYWFKQRKLKPAEQKQVEQAHEQARGSADVEEAATAQLGWLDKVYRAALASELRLLRYLDERRIDGEAVRRFQIGYADGESLQRYFQFRSWKWIPVLAQELGLVRKDERGNEREYFRQRLVIPDLDGERAVYLVGRSTRGEQKIKYIGLSGVPKPLFGFARLERGGDYQRVFVAEGPFDALTLMMWDLPAVCLLGSYLKKDLRRTLERFERVYVVTDFDAAGQTAARVIACELGARATIVPSDLSLQGKDVNEIAQRYRDATARFERLVARADARSQMSAAVQDALRRLHAHNAAHPEREDIAWALLWKVMDVIGAEIEHGHTVVLWSRAYANHVGGKTSPVGGHIIRTIGALRGPNLHYSARRKGRADAECDLLSAEYIEVLDETGC